MSWSAYYIGTPTKIVEALEEQSKNSHGSVKAEFDAALPHMVGLIKQNTGADKEPILSISANGSAWGGHSSCTVDIKNLGSTVLY